jgi:uncharacterized hydrophobic protein (TIGR00271 family)
MMDRARALFDLTADQADPAKIDAEVRAGVHFRGTTLWLLAFAIVIASVGLNVNSTAVIIGAMLVSPLMGPIVGVGYAVGVADLRLLRLSLTNLLLATVVSLVASTIYFSISPLAEAQSELLNRTQPTIFDVVIALFGGFAGIVGMTRRERSNVLPGVAIATALMPPLCTAGFGLSRLDPGFFAGAFYLFFINGVFIALATWVMVRVMRLPEIAHANEAASRRAHRGMLLVGLLTALPSVFFAQRLVSDEVFGVRAERFLADVFPSDADTVLITRDIARSPRAIRVTVVGDPVTEARVTELRGLLPQYGLAGTTLEVRQPGSPALDLAAARQSVAQEAFPQLLARLEAAQARVAELERGVLDAQEIARGFERVEAELIAQLPSATEASVATSTGPGGLRAVLALVTTDAPLSAAERARTTRWLGVRTSAPVVGVFDQRPAPPIVPFPPTAPPR